MVDNVIPFIGGEEEKSEKEPLKVWGKVEGDQIVSTETPLITTQCLRVPVSDGHTAAVFVSFDQKPSKKEILNAWKEFAGVPQELNCHTLQSSSFTTLKKTTVRRQRLTATSKAVWQFLLVVCGRYPVRLQVCLPLS